MFGRKLKPLLMCEVLHQLPGRVRIHCRALRYLHEQKQEIEERVSNVRAIQSARVTPITENILILFDPDDITADAVLESTEWIISSYSLIAYKEEREILTQPTVNERRLQEEPIGEMATRVAVCSATLLFAFFRKAPKKIPDSIFSRFFTMPALTAISLGVPIFKSGLASLRKTWRPNADTLSASALLASLMAGRDFSALTIIWLADIAELLTAYTMERTRRAIREMLSVGEEFVWRITDKGKEEKVALEALQPGDRVIAHTGVKISVDGIVEEGQAAVDQASITGEFLPVQKNYGDQVFAGTVVKSGNLIIRAEKVGDQTAVARIVHLVEEASHRKASIQAFADRFSAQFIPFNFALAGLIYMLTKSATRALNMLVIDYSCGVRLSTATAFSATICTAARNGVLVKGGNYIEMMADTDTLILDKTGTLTEGKPEVVSIIPVNGCKDSREVVELAAAAEESSTHPMAVAILDKIRLSGWKIPNHSETKVHVARGVETKVGRTNVRVGSRRFMQDLKIDITDVHDQVVRMAKRGENVIYVARGKKLVGVLGIQDALRENMKKALNRLRFIGMDDIILLTGDVEQHAEIVADRMQMDRYKAEVLPEDKAEAVLQLQSKGTRVVMVGDGINDAPALAYADVGIAMGGTRTDIAMEAADITITSDDPLMIPGIVRLAHKNMSIVRQNFAIAIGVNTVGLMLASLGILPVFWGAVLHNSCTVAVVLNSGRLLFHDIERGHS